MSKIIAFEAVDEKQQNIHVIGRTEPSVLGRTLIIESTHLNPGAYQPNACQTCTIYIQTLKEQLE